MKMYMFNGKTHWRSKLKIKNHEKKNYDQNKTKQNRTIHSYKNITKLKCKISELTEVRSSNWIMNEIRCSKIFKCGRHSFFLEIVSSIYAIDKIKMGEKIHWIHVYIHTFKNI